MRSGFVTLAGRPNVGKSTLLNALVGQKVSIVSDKPQTTRTQVRAVVNRPHVQLVFVDTPGIHKPVTALGKRLNATAVEALDDIDVYGLVLDATQPFGRGDRFVAARLPPDRTVVVVTKIDLATPEQVLGQLGSTAELEASAYFPVSSVTGEGVPALLDHLVDRMPEGPAYFPPEVVSDVPEAEWVAELVREQLLAATRDELPYSIATRVTEWEWPRVRVEIVVERESQKGMVIGKGGSVLKAVGSAVRAAMPEGAFLELHVTVDKDWQRRPDRITRLGY
jgi:GTP-binding protein Era